MTTIAQLVREFDDHMGLARQRFAAALAFNVDVTPELSLEEFNAVMLAADVEYDRARRAFLSTLHTLAAERSA